jgi:hypothetical protein
MQVIRVCTGLYKRWTYTEIVIVPPLINRYEKIFTVVVFDAPRIFAREEHRSRSTHLLLPML